MEKKFVDSLNREVYESDLEFANTFSSFINGQMCSRKDTAELMSKDHRYLLGEKFRLMMSYIEILASDYENGRYDGRNEWACKCSKEIIDTLKEKNLY